MTLHRENEIMLGLKHWRVTSMCRCNAAWLSAQVGNVLYVPLSSCFPVGFMTLAALGFRSYIPLVKMSVKAVAASLCSAGEVVVVSAMWGQT